MRKQVHRTTQGFGKIVFCELSKPISRYLSCSYFMYILIIYLFLFDSFWNFWADKYRCPFTSRVFWIIDGARLLSQGCKHAQYKDDIIAIVHGGKEKKKERKAISFVVISHNLLIQIMKQMPLRFSGHEDRARLAAWPLSSPTPHPHRPPSTLVVKSPSPKSNGAGNRSGRETISKVGSAGAGPTMACVIFHLAHSVLHVIAKPLLFDSHLTMMYKMWIQTRQAEPAGSRRVSRLHITV